jgi:hypothetical protein
MDMEIDEEAYFDLTDLSLLNNFSLLTSGV